jgi:hypothetical protein
MAIGLNSILQFTLVGKYNATITCLNRFYYRVSELGEVLAPEMVKGESFARGLWRKVGSPLRTICTTQMRYERVDWAEYDLSTGQPGLGGTYLIPSGEQAGTSAGDTLPPFVSVGFKYLRPSTEFRHGYKRFSGISEGITANGFVSATEPGLLALSVALSQDIGYWVSDTASTGIPLNAAYPVLIRKIVSGQPLLPQVAGEPVGIQHLYALTSQNTRKYGRGV